MRSHQPSKSLDRVDQPVELINNLLYFKVPFRQSEATKPYSRLDINIYIGSTQTPMPGDGTLSFVHHFLQR